MVACFTIICVLFSGAVYALKQDEARVLPVWSSEIVYPGSSVTVQIFFTSNYSEELIIHRVGLHFDWMTSDSFVGINMIDNPVTIPSNGSYTFPPINILIPQDVSVGTHAYFVGVDGIQGGSTPEFQWNSLTRALQIQDSGEPINNNGTQVEGQQDSWLIIVGVAVAVGVAALIAIFIFGRKRKNRIS